MQQTDQKKQPSTYAVVFHSVAGSFLAAYGFTLAADPGVRGRYGDSSAFYRSERGLALSVVFDPYDSDAAWINFGREWTRAAQASFLSNNYSKLAHRLGLNVPLSYRMNHKDPVAIFVETIAADLRRTFPTVVSKLSLSDLLAVESEAPTGAAAIAATSLGSDYAAGFDISDFHE